MNKVILTEARIGKIDLRETTGNTEVLTLSLATNDSYKDKNGEWQEQTDWHRVIKWKPSEYLKTANVGDEVEVEGKLKTRDYEKDGQKVYVTEIVAQNIRLRKKSANIPVDNVEIEESGDGLPF